MYFSLLYRYSNVWLRLVFIKQVCTICTKQTDIKVFPVLSMSCGALLLWRCPCLCSGVVRWLVIPNDSAKVRTFFEYPNFSDKKIQTFLHFVCKCLKISTLQKQNFSYLQNDKNRQKGTGKKRIYAIV